MAAGTVSVMSARFSVRSARQEGEVAQQGFALYFGASDLFERFGDFRGGAVPRGESHIQLGGRSIAPVADSGGYGGFEDFAGGAEVVVGDPLPQPELFGPHEGPVVEDFEDRFRRIF